MRRFSEVTRLAALPVLIGLIIACAGPRPGPDDTAADLEKDTLPVVSPPPASKPAKPAPSVAETNQGEAALERADKIKFMYEDIYFKRGSTKLDSEAVMLLDKKALWLHDHPEAKVVIEGHTDYRGSKEYNLALGDRRAGAVKSYLIRKGIARERLMAISYGKEKPAVAGRTEKDRAKNRRVHFAIEER